MNTNSELKAKERPGLGQFDWQDPFKLDAQLDENERLIRDSARAFAEEKLAPRVIDAYREETTNSEIFTEMGEMGPKRHTSEKRRPGDRSHSAMRQLRENTTKDADSQWCRSSG